MAADVFTAKVNGVEIAIAELRALAPKLRKRAIMNALRAGAREVRGAMRGATPALAVPVRRRGRIIRTPGTVRRAISVRTSRLSARAGNLGVFINVKPAKGSNRGIATDPFYWRFLKEFAGAGGAALRAGAGALVKAKTVIEEKLGREIVRLGQKGSQP